LEYKLSREWKDFCKTLITLSEEEININCVCESRTIEKKYDKGYKYLLSIKKNFIEFIKSFTELAIKEELTEENIKLLDKEFITVDFDKKESDIIYEVKLKTEKIYFILLEIQSKVERKMTYRILNYMVEIWRKWEVGYKLKGEKFSLPKIIPCVLYTGEEDGVRL